MLRCSPLDLVIPICIRVQKGRDGVISGVAALPDRYIDDMPGTFAVCAEDLYV